ncbi:MAG: hybrid sensor histidine kinase/response regulator [Methanospirillum sp.]|nr:hybrid sensor histidine kinase/response regulator [Methanospirillum sp.]
MISILFVDDEPGILDAVRMYLEDTGLCRVDTVQSASEAQEKLQKRPYDAIIADYIMPDVDGIRFLQIVRKQYGDIPFILYTGVDREEVLIEAINNGVNFYLQKGGDPLPQFAELLHIIEQAVEKKKAEQELKKRNEDLVSANQKLSQALQELTATKNELDERNQELTRQQEVLNQSHKALKEANKQLNLLSSITRHDILNRIMVLNGYLSIIREESNDPAIAEYLNVLDSATNAIKSQIAFTRIYQDLGTQEPQWIPVQSLVSTLRIPEPVHFEKRLDDIEIYADPITGNVFENLLDNTIRHGSHVTRIRYATHPGPGTLSITWEDDGAGIAEDEKEKIFGRGYGKNTGLGLFLVREILSLTGIGIRETGKEGEGARFEILVPEGKWRYRNRT